MLIFWPIMLFSNAQKIPNNKCSRSAPIIPQYIAHYAQVEPIIKLIKTDMRHKDTQLHYCRV